MGSASRFIRRANLVAGTFLVLSCVPVHAQEKTHQTTQTQNQTDADAAQHDAASFNQFLNAHPDVEKQLHANPYLINDPNFLSTQPALKAFLSDHPHVKDQLQQSPVDFIRRGNSAEGAASNAARVDTSAAVLSERETGRMDEFLEEHGDVEQQLELNPALISDPSYLAQHQDLKALLNAHPQIRQEFSANPEYFTNRGNQATSANGQPNYREIGRMDEFLDVHQEIRWQLKQNPLLVNDSQYLAQHPELALFLNAHPEVRQQFSEHPEYFALAEKPDKPMSATATTTAAATTTPRAPSESATRGPAAAPMNPAPANADVSDVNRARPSAPAVNPNLEFAKQERTRIDQFLDDHPNIAKDLAKNPWLINQSKYLKHHKELDRFLEEHPQVRKKAEADPPYFTERQNESGFEHMNADAGWRTMQPNGDLNDRNVTLMDQFLVKHKKTAKELGKDPMLVTSQHYLDHNKDLRKFFEEHPQILVEFRQNPRNFMEREDQLRAQVR